jgi:hypothetical protein
MFSDWVIGRLYMRVLNFPQFSVFQCEASGRSLLASGRVELHSSDHIFSSPDRRSLVVRVGSVYVRTHAATNGRTVVKCGRGPRTIRTGTPQELYIPLGAAYSTLPHQNLPFWHLVHNFQ